MAKALLGHLGGTDPRVTARLASENRRLRERVADLEAYVLRLQAENDQLVAVAPELEHQLLDESMQPA
ncbi:hypothetical protein D9V37_04450 [Nocardioides mangrovicus]|uniref:Uncharacterized protein n=1 Tax=Nocardioides mangrovicus TaxID=2478913 RepID=A0A3L8P948_9ACTN|nr:hypothetical protein [Nocardioides mangrovicus]RLV51168.1 hypothetical protein D9V37_04450 [Nocardioides mangrovicus]